MYKWEPCGSGSCRNQKRVSDTPGSRIMVVMSHHVDAVNRTQVLCTGDMYSYLLSHLTGLAPLLFSILRQPHSVA